MARSIEELLQAFAGRGEGREAPGSPIARSSRLAFPLSPEAEADIRRELLPHLVMIVGCALRKPDTRIPFHRRIREAAAGLPAGEIARFARAWSKDPSGAGPIEIAAPAEETPAGAGFDRSALTAMTHLLARRLCDAILRSARRSWDTIEPDDTR